MNRTPALLALCGLLLLAALMVLPVGCQRSTDQPGQTATDQAAAENAQLRETLERTGKTMEELAGQVERQQSREAQKSGEPPVSRDLAVVRATLTDAQKLAAAGTDAATTGAIIARLRRTLQSLAAELPAALIVQHADRAMYEIKATTGVGSKDFSDASLEVVAAYDAANHGRPADLVPAVTNDLEGALKALKKGDSDGTLKTLNEVVGKCLENAALKILAQAQVEALNAETALGRGAWPVVGAELAQLDTLISQIVVAKPAEKKTEAAPTTTAPATPTSGATPGAAPAADGAAPPPGQQAPATTAPAQPAAAAPAPATAPAPAANAKQ